MADEHPPRPTVTLEITAPRLLYVLPIPTDAPRFDHRGLEDYARSALGPGFTVERLAAHLNLSPTFTRYLLRGERQPNLWTYANLIAAADVPLGSFVNGLAQGAASQVRG